MNWAEREIMALSNRYGVGDFIFIDSAGRPQAKQYHGIWSSYPDIENKICGRLIMLIEVKSRKKFHQNNCFLGLKTRQLRSYKRVQNGENESVRIVYLIGNSRDYSIYWEFLNNIDVMEHYREKFQDSGDRKPDDYMFFHYSLMRDDLPGLFNPLESE